MLVTDDIGYLSSGPTGREHVPLDRCARSDQTPNCLASNAMDRRRASASAVIERVFPRLMARIESEEAGTASSLKALFRDVDRDPLHLCFAVRELHLQDHDIRTAEIRL
jgi:hypothetical protein